MEKIFGKNANKLIFIMVYFLVCVIPLNQFLMSDSEYSVDLGMGNYENFYSIKENAISQNIAFDGTLGKIGFYFKTNIIDESENSCIEVIFEQGGNEKYYQIPLNKISTDSFYYIKPKLRDSSEAETIVKLFMNSECKNDVYVVLCQDEKTGLDGVVVNNEEQDSPILINYSFTQLKITTIVGIILFSLIQILIIFFVFWTDHKKAKDWHFIIISILVILFTISVRQPAASYMGEPRSEAAYDFWQNAKENGFLGSLFRLECNLYYLSFLQRIGAWIATILSPSSKYAFVIMQMIQVLFIALECGLVWSKKIIFNLNKYSRFLLSICFGTLLLPLYTYYYHFFGYWGIIFILIMSVMDMRKISRLPYTGILILTSIICLSKMAYVVLVPFAFIMAILLNKKLKEYKKYCVWMADIVLSCIFQVAYTFTHTSVFNSPEGALGTISIPNIKTLINGLFYYAVQGINTFLFGSIHQKPIVANTIILVAFLTIIFLSLYQAIVRKNLYSKLIIAYGTMYFSVIGFLILTSGGGFSMISSINWNYNVLLVHVHFAFIKYIIIFVVLFTLEKYASVKSKNIIICGLIISLTVVGAPRNDTTHYTLTSKLSMYPTEWKKVYQITENDSYYSPINVEYQYAGISLVKNSYGVLYGFNTNGEWGLLGTGISFNESTKYSEAQIETLNTGGILSVSARKANVYLNTKYIICMYDMENNIIAKIEQANSTDREWIDFIFEKPIYGAYRVKIIDAKTGKDGYIRGELNIGVSTLSRQIDLDEEKYVSTLLMNNANRRTDITFSLEYANGELILGQKSISINRKEDVINLTGWSGCETMGETLKALYIKIDDDMYKATYGIERMDVCEATQKDSMLYSGFSFSIPIGKYLDKNSHDIQAIIVDQKECIEIVDLTIEFK